MREQDILNDPEARREFEEEKLFGEAVANIAGLLESLGITRQSFADRLGISAGRVTQMLSGERNLTLRTLGAMAWALGYETEIRIRPMQNRTGTPAVNDPPAPDWVYRLLHEGGPTDSVSIHVADFFASTLELLEAGHSRSSRRHKHATQAQPKEMSKVDNSGLAA